jgi:serine/threonine-protein kinase RsbW
VTVDAAEGATRITLSLPAGPEHIRLARLVASGLVAQLDFGLDDVEDLRIAVDELCALVVEHARPSAELTVAFEVVEHVIAVRVTAPGPADADDGAPVVADELSRLILMAAADEHVLSRADGEVVAWMRKRPTAPTG